MLLYWLSIVATALSLLVVAAIFPGVSLVNIPAAVVAAVIIGIINGIVKPALFISSLPITVLTLGLFSLVLNGLCFWLASLLTPGFSVSGFWAVITGPVVLSVVSAALTSVFVGQLPGTHPGAPEGQH